MRRLALAAALGASLAQVAAAQTGDRWLIVPVATSADSWVEPTTLGLYDELSARGVAVWSPAEAARRFEAKGSAPAPVRTEAETREWTKQSKAMLENLVRGNPAGALQIQHDAELLSRANVVALNREPKRAQEVLDTCLLSVRAQIETGSPSKAEAMARKCRRLVVGGAPNPHMHPPSVTALLVAADRYRADQATVLHVGSEPSGCSVRVNGVLRGRTPLEEAGLLPGSYAVQVECDPERSGRVRYASVELGLTEVFADTRFDDAVVTRPTLALRYADAREALDRRSQDAAKITAVLSAAAIVLVSAPDTSTQELELLRGPTLDEGGFARIKGGSGGPTRGDTALAARTLVDGKCMDLATLPPTALPCRNETGDATPPVKHPARMPRGKFISGMTLFAAGSASLLGGYVLLGPRARAAEDWVQALDAGQSSAALQQKWINMGIGLVVTSSVGAGLLVTSMPLALPKRDQTPWWAWLSGGLGVGLAAFSIAYGVTAESEPGASCSSLLTDPTDARTCVNRSEQISVAVLTGATAAPLLTIPLVYLFRPSKSKLTPELEVSQSGGYVAVHGRF